VDDDLLVRRGDAFVVADRENDLLARLLVGRIALERDLAVFLRWDAA